MQGRIYADTDRPKGKEFDEWYKSLAGWIRRNFAKNPVTGLDGYIGPAVLQWFENGGILLPTFLPPVTQQWLAFVDAEHADLKREH
jgi:hypothetical protein